MKVLDDILASLSGVAKTRVSDPFIGTFTISWIICNWNHIALLLWGGGTVSDRVNEFQKYLSLTGLFGFNSVFVIPLMLALFYLFAFPWLSLVFKYILKNVNDRLHKQAVDVELDNIRQQEELNKARLRSNPEKQFLEQTVQWDIDRKVEVLGHIKLRTERLQAKLGEQERKKVEAEANTAEAKSRAAIAELEEDSKKKQAELDKQKFNVTSAKLRATLASHRFPSVYVFMSKLDDSLKSDDITLSLMSIGEVVAAIFGYKDFQSVLDDDGFNNDAFSNVEYIYYDSDDLAGKLENIVFVEGSRSVNLTSDLLFDHVLMMFDDFPFELVDLDALEERAIGFFEENKYSLFDFDSVAIAIAESDSIFDEVEFEAVNISVFELGFTTKFQAYAKGAHRKYSVAPMRTMNISVEIRSRLKVGKRSLGGFEFVDVYAELDDVFEPEDAEGE